jgi:hypothetical protein
VIIDKAEWLLKEDRRLLLRELSDVLNMSVQRVLHVTVELGMSKCVQCGYLVTSGMSRKKVWKFCH